MAKKLTMQELRNKSGKVTRALDEGEDFVITHHGQPIGELRPYKRRQFVRADQFIAALKNAPSIDYEELRADLDRYVDQDPTPRYFLD